MFVSKRTAVALLAASALAGSATTAVTALGDPRNGGGDHQGHGNRSVLDTSLAPSVPTDPTLLGAAAGNVPWVLQSGAARLHRSDGDARITAMFTLPTKCQIPALLIHPNGAPKVYIATSGFGE